MISQNQIDEIVEKIAMNYDPERILLFGSYANGNPNDDSDLDFIIIKNTDKPKHQRGREIRRFLIGSKVPIDLKVYTPQEFDSEQKSDFSFLSSVIKGTKILYERKN
jgi:uncharacterized protein